MAEQNTTRDGFGQGLLEAAANNPSIVGLCADLTESTRMHWFAESHPDRFIDLGVAEQNLAGIAAGLALAGKHPFAASYATFSPGNNWGPIRSSICYSNLPVTIVGGHSGVAIGADGATHQGLEDIALMRVLPNMTVVVPADREEARKATRALATHNGPSYLRISKYESAAVTTKDTAFELGKAIELMSGSDITLIACGSVVASAIAAAKKLATEKISTRVLDMHTIKPIDQKAIHRAFSETNAVVTIEDHQIAGGLGSAVAECAVQSGTGTPQRLMGINDQFGASGTAAELFEAFGLTVADIVRTAKDALTQRRS